MDHVTFRHPAVVEAVSQVVMLRVDVTRGASDEVAAFLSRSRIYGAPTMLFIDRAGSERLDLRLAGFAGPEEFLERLAQILHNTVTSASPATS
jgi:thiol:disulfide interchange protein DsbD